MDVSATKEVQTIYHRLLEAWNHRSARGMAELFAPDGESIGFDGSQAVGPDEIFAHLDPIFADHPTARFISKVRHVHFLSSETALLRSIAGMVPPGKHDINPQTNTHHTLIVVKSEGSWRIRLFQNTPAQFHGRPELVEQMTEELRETLT